MRTDRLECMNYLFGVVWSLLLVFLCFFFFGSLKNDGSQFRNHSAVLGLIIRTVACNVNGSVVSVQSEAVIAILGKKRHSFFSFLRHRHFSAVRVNIPEIYKSAQCKVQKKKILNS